MRPEWKPAEGQQHSAQPYGAGLELGGDGENIKKVQSTSRLEIDEHERI
jgi:hypothetical protein